MPTTKSKPLPIHAVIWEDATYQVDSQPETVLAVTVGVILEETPKVVKVASEVFSDGGHRHYTTIPRGMVRTVVRVGRIKKVLLERARGENGGTSS